jgi:coniferyl-aldehyde dehydrogenase
LRYLLVSALDDARLNGATVETIAPVGESLPDRATKKIAPTIVRDVNDRMRIAQEEIFGPILVVRPYSELTDVIDYIKPAALPAGGVLVRT